MKIDFDLATPLPDKCLLLVGAAANGARAEVSQSPTVSIEATREKSPALAVWEKWRELKPLHGETLIVQGPQGFRSSFHYQIAVYIANALIALQQDYRTSNKIDGEDKPLDKHLLTIQNAGFPDSDVFGHGLAQLACYAQAEWTGAFIPCPLERRIRSIFIALQRTCNDERTLYENVSPAKSQVAQLGMISVLFQCSLRSASIPIGEDAMVMALKANWGCSMPTYPSSPRLEGVFDNFVFSGHYWLKSLVERLKRDRDAYKRDAARATKDYSVLIDDNGKIAPVETIRIASPESLLFDLWAWQDCESSKEHSGFPLVWIDNGWYTQRFELRLDRSIRKSLKSLEDQKEALTLPDSGRLCDAGWSLTYSNGTLNTEESRERRSDVRYRLKRKFFPAEASFTGEFISIRPDDCTAERPCAPLEWSASPSLLDQAIRESKPGDEQKIPGVFNEHKPGTLTYLWAEVEFAEIDIYETWAGDEIATILYSLLRPASGMTLPNDFLKNHVHRSPGMVYAWAREGMVVAHQRDKSMVEKLKQKFEVAARLERDLGYQIEKRDKAALDERMGGKSEGDDSTKNRINKLVTRHLGLRQSSAEPEFRALRGFLDRRHAQEIYDAFRQSEADKNQLQTLDAMNQSSDRLNWLEAVLFAFAITEAGYILGEALLPDSWVFATVCASILGAFAATLFLLIPKWKIIPRKVFERIGKTLLVIVFATIYIVALILSWNHKGGKKGSLPATSPNPPCSSLCSPEPPAQSLPAAASDSAKSTPAQTTSAPKPIAAKPTAIEPANPPASQPAKP